ncbi:altronate dehydratase family protein [Neolewinella lacunae]|uniref:Altronate dehydratase n=1 Tax=Neolewinella lacunae TaxID=1517758 RepID=A0A923T7W3_9BACT|nr:altronate dehydratase family protein [Neolewinella lacunae]MBC6993313.1 altronate dehydratase [Neolewinella lacunae]MDN3636846.1 altronate dehydratase family protein [Neolewinella lacunae]
MPERNLLWLRLDARDNVAVALRDLAAGTLVEVDGISLRLKTATAAKHKFTLMDLPAGGAVYMYGTLVGEATEPIWAGSALHTGNLVHAATNYGPQTPREAWLPPTVERWRKRHFMGYHRADGRVGTANYWLVIPLVFCENRNVEVIREAMLEGLGYGRARSSPIDLGVLVEAYRAGQSAGAIMALNPLRPEAALRRERVFPNVDGIKFLTHDGGCGGIRQDAEVLCRILAGYIAHPNVAGATVLSLGCQNAQIPILQQALAEWGLAGKKTVHYLEQQAVGDERTFIAEAVKKTFAGLMEANLATRAPAPLSALTLGLECGGSDGFSGISANPVLGYVSDLLVALGGSAVLAEFPELNGVEQELIDRCVTPALANKFSRLMQEYAAAAEAVGSGFKNNPSPGNIRDGLITDAMKSAGAARKGGSSPVTDVLDYAEPVVRPGLNLLCTPGNDVESTTGLAGSGCNLIVFTTGLGTPTGNPIVPVVKMASNHALALRMADLIDFDAGGVITGATSIEQRGEDLLEYLLGVASGTESTAAQRLGQDDFIPWKRGVSL